MNRAKSIKDIGDIYRAMQMASASTQLNEAVDSKKSQKVKAKFPKDTFKKSEETVKEPSTFKKGGPKNVKGLTKAKKNKNFSQKTKKVVKEDINNFMSIFDKLYEDVMKNDELDINTGIGMGPEGDSGDSDSDFDFGGKDESDSGDEVTITLDKDLAQKLLEVLQDVVGEESESDKDLEDLGVDSDEDEESEDDDEEMYETTDIEKLPDSAGHKLQKGMDAAGNIRASSGKADSKVTDTVGTETGKHPMDHKSELTNPSKNKVGSLKTGKSLFDQ